MVSFARLLEELEKNKMALPLMDSGESNKVLNLIKTGSDLREKNETSFWDEFIGLCSNSEGLSELLGVTKDKVNSWPSRIKNYINELESKNINISQKEKQKVIPTADTGAVVTNQDPKI